LHAIKPTFTIDEPNSTEHRQRFLTEHAKEAAVAAAKEHQRRERGRKKAGKNQQCMRQTGELDGQGKPLEAPNRITDPGRASASNVQCAAYQSAPASAITHLAPVKQVDLF
jgi:hypothetical protein